MDLNYLEIINWACNERNHLNTQKELWVFAQSRNQAKEEEEEEEQQQQFVSLRNHLNTQAN